MPQSLSAVYLHAVFSTKERWPYLRDPAFRAEVHKFLAGITKRLDCPPIEIGGMEDHAHVLSRLGRTITQADWIKEMKRACTEWINDQRSCRGRFAWQAGYGVFSVSPSSLKAVRNYILQQEERHKKLTFQDEFRALLRKHGLEWDERLCVGLTEVHRACTRSWVKKTAAALLRRRRCGAEPRIARHHHERR